MVKNEKGVTLLILVITIIIIFILMGVSVNTGYTTLINARTGRVISNLNLIKIKVESIYDDYQFSENEELLVGANDRKYSLDDIIFENSQLAEIENEIPNYDSIATEKKWYEWNESILKLQGLDTKILKDDGKIFVNYEDSEIIYTKGATMNNRDYYYTLSGIEKEFENE